MPEVNDTEDANKHVLAIRCVIFDLDGVLTDGAIYLDEQGKQLRRYHVHDGIGIKLLQAASIEVAIITTTPEKIIEPRMKQLGIKHYLCGKKNKVNDYHTLLETLQLDDSQIAYMGDDFPDLPLLKKVGLPATVSNGTTLVKDSALFISKAQGGNGAVREFSDFILTAQNKLHRAMSEYLKT